MENQKQDREKSMLLALFLFLGAGGLVFAYLSGDGGKKAGRPQVIKSEKYEQSVNRHLMLTNERMELEKQRMAVENATLLNTSISGTRPQRAYTNENKLDLSSDTRAEEMAQELGRVRKQESVDSPHDIVQKELFNEQQAQQYSQAYREEYARQFIENARRGGYKVQLSEDLTRVISVQPLRDTSSDFNIYGGTVSGRQ